MNPPSTGIRPAASSGESWARARAHVSRKSGSARPATSLVTMQRRASTQLAGRSRAASTPASSDDERRSPKETTSSRTRGRVPPPWEARSRRRPISSRAASSSASNRAAAAASSRRRATTRCRSRWGFKSAALAASTLASSASVTPLIAETTTTGRARRSARTISVTRSNAAVSSTDVPPNLSTVGGVDSPDGERPVIVRALKGRLTPAVPC